MRVVGGKYRHRELVMPQGDATRPTKDMVREAIFSALGTKVINAYVLDLFAGSGAFAIEAISRGAQFAYMVDNDLNACKAIRENLKKLNINYPLLDRDYLDAISYLQKNNTKVDIIFIDPPYKMNNYQKIIDEVSPLLNDNSTLVIESNSPISVTTSFTKKKEYKYGKTFVTILWK